MGLKQKADDRLERALAGRGVSDPRPFYRPRLKYLKASHESAYEDALNYYENRVVPECAEETGDPVEIWLAYGLHLAGLGGHGRTLTIDASGRAIAHEGAVAPGEMVLHLPDEERAPAFAINSPADPSPAQRATFDLLVAGKREVSATSRDG